MKSEKTGFLFKLDATLNFTAEVFKKVSESIPSMENSKSILLDKRCKIIEGMTYLYKERKIAANHKPKNKNLIKFYDQNIGTLHGLYGKINQMLYFDRSMTGINGTSDNLFTPLKDFFQDAQSQDKAITGLEDFIDENIKPFKIHRKDWENKPAVYKFFDWNERHRQYEKQTHAEIYGIFNNNKINAKNKALQIHQLVNKRKPNIVQQLWRKEEKLRYEEMGLKAELLCLLDGFAKGEFCELGLKSAVQELLRVYPNVENINQLSIFLERVNIIHEANIEQGKVLSTIPLENLLNQNLSQSASLLKVMVVKKPEDKTSAPGPQNINEGDKLSVETCQANSPKIEKTSHQLAKHPTNSEELLSPSLFSHGG